MSCHDIGRGINTIVERIVELYDEGKYSTETARDLIATSRNGVHWCDGNEDEAVECIRRCRCGRCLKKMKAGEYLFSVWDVSSEVKNVYKIMDIEDNDGDELASDKLCEECFKIVMNKYCNDPTAGEREMKYILEHEKEEHYLAEEWEDFE